MEKSFNDLNFIENVQNIKGCCPNTEMIDTKKKKIPKKILHFYDGTLEEYSTDEEDTEPKIESIEVDTKILNWRRWFAYWAKHTGKTALDTCDSVGGSIANFLGITSPKYFYEIEEYNRILKEESDEKVKIDEEMAGWTSPKEREITKQEIELLSET